MASTAAFNNANTLIYSLQGLVHETSSRFIMDDNYITDNVNFFSKSFLVITCAYLEGYIKEVIKIT